MFEGYSQGLKSAFDPDDGLGVGSRQPIQPVATPALRRIAVTGRTAKQFVVEIRLFVDLGDHVVVESDWFQNCFVPDGQSLAHQV